MPRSFAELDAQEALHVAIFIEERNAEIYHRFASMFTEFGDVESQAIAGVFWEMAEEERRHSSMLQSRYCQQYGNSGCCVAGKIRKNRGKSEDKSRCWIAGNSACRIASTSSYGCRTASCDRAGVAA